MIVICLLGASTAPAIADESQPANIVPSNEISITAIELTFAVPATVPEVDSTYVKRKAQEYFSDIPVMIAIGECESNFQQYRDDGTLNVSRHQNRKGIRDSSASGVFQILYKGNYEKWAASRNTNITTIEGNFAFARVMYEESGTTPWNESKNCWWPKRHNYELRVADATH